MLTSLRSPKKALRSALDRAVLPYVEQLRRDLTPAPCLDQGLPSQPDEPDTDRYVVPSTVFHSTLHELRTLELGRVSKGARRALSVGASGRWYFDWFAEHYGPLEEHIGVEAFEPRPEDLPAYVRWIESTADRFEDVADGHVGLVFAGQTSEHLWAAELADFLLEANRVLEDGGLLVLDSPNRLITEHLYWSHGGHTVELSSAEMSSLLRLAGFEVEVTRGAWMCRLNGEVWQLEDRIDDPAALTRRIALGPENPDDCFVWWIDARKGPRRPEPESLHRETARLYAEHWGTRVSRGMWAGPGSPGPHTGETGSLKATSLPFYLHPGDWRLTLNLSEGTWSDVTRTDIALTLPGDHELVKLTLQDASPEGDSRTWTFDLEHLAFAVTLTVDIASDEPVRLAMPLTWSTTL